MAYGTELVVDLHECNVDHFTKEGLTEFFRQLAQLTDMELQQRHWWTMDDCPPEWREIPHLNGISCIQFITTSDFRVHALFDGRLYLNIFTCKPFDERAALDFVVDFFEGRLIESHVLTRW